MQEPSKTPTNFEFTAPANLKTFRIAISTTGQYTAYHGQNISGALAAINATLTRVNGIYENEIGVHFELIEQVEQLIYLNRFSDPYFENLGGDLQEVLDDVVGDEHYDIGHLFHQDRNVEMPDLLAPPVKQVKKEVRILQEKIPKERSLTSTMSATRSVTKWGPITPGLFNLKIQECNLNLVQDLPLWPMQESSKGRIYKKWVMPIFT